MDNLTAESPETKSPDLAAENLAKLKALFPEVVTEDGVNVDALKQLIGKTVTDTEEKYGLNWHGKRKARQLALTPSTGTLRPCPDDSVEWDKTQNLMIEGDNLEVLKLLQKSYAGKVKVIYIDPPYNTGKDFVYPDNFQDNIKNYLEITGQLGESGQKLSSNSESSGRFHTDWLNMMYPRVKLARNLLAEDGVIFVSIDDNENSNLRLLFDEIFGGENFVATVVWQKVYAPKSSAKHFSEDHDFVLVYAKNAETWRPTLLARTDEQNAIYKNLDNDPRGDWRPNNLAARNYYSKGTYSIRCPGGRLIEGPPSGSYWRVSEEKFWALDKDKRIWWGQDGNNVPAPKIFLSEVKDGRVPQTLWFYKDVGHNQESKRELLELLPMESSDSVFETPKPTRMIRRILEIATAVEDNDIVMDFFSGSGTTGHAVMLQNAADSGNRRFVCVQLPTTLEVPATLKDGGKLETISELTKERLRRAGKKIREENPMFVGDVGFRVFKLASSNIQAWSPDRQNLAETLEASVDHLKTDRTESDILFELLLKLGLDLTVPIEKKSIAGHDVHSIGAGTLIVCLSKSIATKEVEALALGIAEWHKAQAPAGESTVVFRDSAFADDVAKTNLTAILQQHGLENVRSL
ncbi:MAG: site-specific DNA-methyltransferase [Verrucomicrobiota bacterium]